MGPHSIAAAAAALAASAFARPALASVGARTPDAAAPGVDALLSGRSLQDTCLVGDINLCLSLDESGSICGARQIPSVCPGDSELTCCNRFQKQIDFSTSLTATLGEQFASSEHSLGISIVTFAGQAEIDCELTTDYEAAISKLNEIYYSSGNTNHRDGIAFCQDTFPEPEAGDDSPPKNVILLLTDGKYSGKKTGTGSATNAKNAGSIILPVFISATTDSDVLNYMRGLSNDNTFYQVDNYDELEGLLGQINQEICPPPTSSPASSATSPPTLTPTTSPTQAPTKNPTSPPTSNPTASPSSPPTLVPTSNPTSPPTSNPTFSPSSPPTLVPTSNPTSPPTSNPTFSPSSPPTLVPTSNPTSPPTSNPTSSPSSPPTLVPTSNPMQAPTKNPTSPPTSNPTSSPTSSPTSMPTLNPSQAPTNNPTLPPTSNPTSSPTLSPNLTPTTSSPSTSPTNAPTKNPTSPPTSNPTSSPTLSPNLIPTTSSPSTSPTNAPTKNPTSPPTSGPTTSPISSPTLMPTSNPAQAPTNSPIDINECLQSELNDCDSNAQCANTLGSYTCTCITGWEGNGTHCTNINECDQGTHDCDENALCTDTDGSWECACPEGWIGNGILCETLAPSSSPSKKPTTPPTISPSSLPSLQPSIVEQFITIVGRLSVNRDICAFTPQQLDAYVRSALAAIQEVIGCIDEDLCTAKITNNVCGKYPVSQSSSRMLQTEDWQLDYEITESFTCEYASCNSAGDSATTQSVIAGTVAPIESSLSSDQFLAILSQNIINTGEFDASVVTCFAVWGIVEEPELAVAPVEDETGLFYPDWDDHSGTCLRGYPPVYMELNPEGWLFDTLEGCCARYYGGWNYNKCMNIQGSGLWYVSHINELCVTDCEEGQGKTCGGLANPISDDLYADPRSCCIADLPWRFVEFCESESLLGNCYAGTGLYYRGDTAGSKVCVRDCDPSASGDTTCGGLVEDTYIVLHDSADECCSAEYGWMTNELCAARSDQVDINKYWPDKTNSKCILDSHDPAEDLSISIYNSTAECCEKGIHWLSEVECLTASGDSTSLVASYMFFVDWENERCVQDCEGAAPCEGLGKLQAWDETYDTSQQCCDEIHWVPREDCV